MSDPSGWPILDFEFGGPGKLSLTSHVPPPHVVVDLRDAWKGFKKDIRRGEHWLTEGTPSIVDAEMVFRNSFRWVRFWSVRHPDPETREWFEQELERIRADARRIEKELPPEGGGLVMAIRELVEEVME